MHSVTRSCHDGFPSLYDGNRVVNMTLTKDVPALVRVAGFDCRVWYRRQPAFCSICKRSGHRSKSCPLDGLCRRCRQPGHVAKECRNTWGSAPRSSSSPPAAASAAVPDTVPAAAASTSDAVLTSDVRSSAADDDDEGSDMEFVPGPVPDDDSSLFLFILVTLTLKSP